MKSRPGWPANVKSIVFILPNMHLAFSKLEWNDDVNNVSQVPLHDTRNQVHDNIFRDNLVGCVHTKDKQFVVTQEEINAIWTAIQAIEKHIEEKCGPCGDHEVKKLIETKITQRQEVRSNIVSFFFIDNFSHPSEPGTSSPHE